MMLWILGVFTSGQFTLLPKEKATEHEENIKIR